MKKGYKFTEEQLANRKRKAKGKWSKKARERQSLRLKGYWQAKKKQEPTSKPCESNGATLISRVLMLEQRVNQLEALIGGV